MKKIQHYIEFYFLNIFAKLIRILPLRIAKFLVRRLADFVFYFVPLRKKIVLKNLTSAFSDLKTLEEIKTIARNVYYQFGQTIIELLFFPKIKGSALKEMVTIENFHLLEEAKKNGKGAVLVGAHFGNWEVMGAVLAQYYPVTFIVGQQKNILVDNLLNSYRIAKGIKIIPLKMALRGALRALKANEFIAILADQDAHKDGVFVNFFGKPASTPKGPALFSLHAGCPLLMGHIIREKNKFRIIFDKVNCSELTGDENIDIKNYTQSYTKILENYCRKYPDHWFWFHKRWKTHVSEGGECLKFW